MLTRGYSAVAVQVKETEGLRFLTSKAGVIDGLEFTMPCWLKRRYPEWYPPYIHILRVSILRLHAIHYPLYTAAFSLYQLRRAEIQAPSLQGVLAVRFNRQKYSQLAGAGVAVMLQMEAASQVHLKLCMDVGES